jgi:hypothetical protein
MAIGIVFQGDSVSQEQYERIAEQVMPGDQLPPGLRYHAAGFSENGMVVFEVWDTQEAAQQFFDETLGPALQAANVSVQPTFLQIAKSMQP